MLRLCVFLIFWFSSSVATSSAEIVHSVRYGHDWVDIKGKINLGDDVKFKNLILELARKGVAVSGVGVFSPGGAVYPSLRIGRYIRTLYLGTWAPIEHVPSPFNMNVEFWTRVYQTRYCIMDEKTGMDPKRGMNFNMVTKQCDPNCVCASACFLIWAAGAGTNQVSRNEVPGAMKQRLGIDIHRPYFDPKEYALWPVEDARGRYETIQKVVGGYLRDMEVPETIVRRMFSIPSNQVSRLTHEEALLMNERSLLPPYLDEMYVAKCGEDHEKCGKKFGAEIYFQQIRELEKMDKAQ
jgi:hypothetical protein